MPVVLETKQSLTLESGRGEFIVMYERCATSYSYRNRSFQKVRFFVGVAWIFWFP